jgi:hypothetical protein
MPHYVYILSNPSFRGIYKVGYTTKAVEQRMGELYSTGVPNKFRLEFCIEVSDGLKAEKHLHSKLHDYRHEKEFFKLSIKQLIEICKNELFKGEIDFIRYYGRSNSLYLSAEEEQEIKNKTAERKILEERKIAAEKSLQAKDKEKEDLNKRTQAQIERFSLLTPRIDEIIRKKSRIINAGPLGRIFGANHFDDGIYIGKIISQDEKYAAIELYEVLVYLAETKVIDRVINENYRNRKNSSSLCLRIKHIQFTDKKGITHSSAAFLGLSSQFEGLLHSAGIVVAEKIKSPPL